jgi:hypothetical protein
VSFFTVAEKLLNLSSTMDVTDEEAYQNVAFDKNWQQGKNNTNNALSDYDAFVKPYLENEKVAVMIPQARNMILAQSYYDYYMVFTVSLSFLKTDADTIAATVATRSGNNTVFGFSQNTMREAIGEVRYDKRYDPVYVKVLSDNVASFTGLFKAGDPAASLPSFLQQVDPSVYESDAFMRYLSSYISYWRDFPEHVYYRSSGWGDFRGRAAAYMPFQVNSILQSLYINSTNVISQIDDSILSEGVSAVKTGALTVLKDKQGFLSSFQSTDAERMLAAWLKLPVKAEDAFSIMQNTSDDQLKASYFTVYSTDQKLRLGWWNDLVYDGVTVLAGAFTRSILQEFNQKKGQFAAYPLCSDAKQPLSVDAVKDLAVMLRAMGAAPPEEGKAESLRDLLHPRLFSGSQAQLWADTAFGFASAVADTQKPLQFTLYQPSDAVQNSLNTGRNLLAVNRFRYVEVSSEKKQPERFSTYMNDQLVLAEGLAEDAGLTLSFFRTSGDVLPSVTVTFDNQWSIFNLYLRQDTVSDTEGKTYVPLYISDSVGQYVYFLEVVFSTAIPKSVVWYSEDNWPKFTVTDSFVSAAP